MALAESLAPEALYRRCDPAQFELESRAALAHVDGVIGQQHALAALRFGRGISIGHENYHLFALAPSGVGRHALVRPGARKAHCCGAFPLQPVLRAQLRRAAATRAVPGVPIAVWGCWQRHYKATAKLSRSASGIVLSVDSHARIV